MSGSIILSAERVAAVTATSSSTSIDDTSSTPGTPASPPVHVDRDESSTNVNLLWHGATKNFFGIPRLGIDAFLGPYVTLGGSAGYISQGGSTTARTTTPSTTRGSPPTVMSVDNDSPDVHVYVISPRLGAVIPLGPRAALWLRGGVTYFSGSSESTTNSPPASTGQATATIKTSIETSGTAVTLDGQVVLIPIDHVGIMFGPVLDIGVGGSTKTTSTSTSSSGSSSSSFSQTFVSEGDVTQSNYGAAVGIVAFF